MSHFDDIIMPTSLRYRSDGRTRPIGSTNQIFLSNGTRKVINRYSEKLRELTGSYIYHVNDSELAQANRIWEICGTVHSFLARDWSLWNTTINYMEEGNENLVTPTDMAMQNTTDGTYVGDGATTQFYCGIKFTEGSGTEFKRIRKPLISSVRVAVDGVEIEGSPSFVITNADNGIVTLDVPPVNNAVVTWGGVFYFPVFFVGDDGYGVEYPFKNVREISGLVMREERLSD